MTDGGWRPDDATAAQIGAADPAASVWLGANAGSGKTKVLTDRVARLLLAGAAPDRILCLTYTRAAAAEMQNRLARTLGGWAMRPDDELRRDLREMGIDTTAISAAALREARTLFARAIETPGGLRIQTIHAFCAGLLRRFPLEAGVSPGFREIDETVFPRMLAGLLDDMAADPEEAPLVDALARRLTASGPEDLLAAVAKLRDALAAGADEGALRAALGLGPEDAATIRAEAIGDALDLLLVLAEAAATDPGTAKAAKHATKLKEAYLADPDRRFALCCEALLKVDGGLPSALLSAKTRKAMPDNVPEMAEALAQRLVDANAALAALGTLERSLALHALAPRFLDRLSALKEAEGLLDYDDQVLRARALLSRRETAQWVLWKLDGGIDHILVDEAQDTSQVQWDVIAALTAEFGAGEGARDVRRTLFVVGDRKQSIFGFQGADPAAFDRMRAVLGRRLEGGAALGDHALRHSFRSAPAVLRTVDAVFDGDTGAGPATAHVAFHADRPGRVDLWPNVDPPEKPEERDWTDPVDRPAADAAPNVLARRIARFLRAEIDAGTPIETGGARRALQPRDVLILFRSRGDLFYATIAACKAAGLPMAGADRLKLADELAVRDLLSLCRFAVTPEDDLSLAEVLRSPLCGLGERDLFDVAHDRAPLSLLRALRAHGGHGAVADMLEDLRDRADFLRPYELLQRALIHHDGRRRLCGRLGGAADEAIDGLLHQALAYEQLEVPSLTGFLGWLDEADIEIKRQGTGGAVRVMTIHGAKGLEAPLVILPQCGTWKAPTPPELLRAGDGGPVIWRNGRREDCAGAELALYEAAQAADRAERDRLLYVALTRAESWLVCASAGQPPKDPGETWAGRVEAALRGLGAAPLVGPGGAGLRLEEGDWTTPPPAGAAAPAPEAAAEALPDWAERPAPPPPADPPLRAPSELGGPKALPGEHRDAIDRDAALRHGIRVHVLLEHLPALPPEARRAAALGLIDRHAPPAPGDDPGAAAAEALAAIDAHPAVFAPDTLAEMPFVLAPEDGRPGLSGTMDRVRVDPDRVLIVDHKTNRVVPADAAAVPEGLLRQLGAYAVAAAAIWPGRRIETAILWTAGARLMTLPHEAVSAAWERASAIDAPSPRA